MEVSIVTRVHLWWTWLRIAARHVGAAKRARLGQVTASSFESASSAALSAEFESSIVAIAAAAFALEALAKALEKDGHQVDPARFRTPPEANRGFWVAQQLIQAFQLQGIFAQELPTRLNDVFGLRNSSVHFESIPKSGLKLHPSGTATAEELTIYTFEEALAALLLGKEILVQCSNSIHAHQFDIRAAEVAREFTGVLAMLDDAIAAEGLP